ncbi:MAG: hypothetical protein ACE5JX_17385 [Acidobacteriota bacterium]
MKKRVALVTLVAGTVVMTGTIGIRGAASRIERTIALGQDEQGQCIVTASPTLIRSAKRNFRIVWNVVNQCQEPVTVGVGNFKLKRNNRPGNPLELGSSPTVPAGGTSRLEGRVKVLPSSQLGTYKYDILLDGTVAVDPELEVDG